MDSRAGQIESLISHYVQNWGTNYEILDWTGGGPIHKTCPEFKLLRFRPRPSRAFWTYATVGMSLTSLGAKVELHMFAPSMSEEIEEILVATASYHLDGASLGVGDTVFFGKPWMGSSEADCGLLSLPYLDGPELEWHQVFDERIRCLWLIPITSSERRFAVEHGVDMLESRFEESQFDYCDPLRGSVV